MKLPALLEPLFKRQKAERKQAEARLAAGDIEGAADARRTLNATNEELTNLIPPTTERPPLEQ